MSIDQQTPQQTTDRLALCWKAVKQAYRTLNTVTHHAISTLFKVLVVIYFLFCAAVLGLRYVVLPNIDSYKPEVESLVTRAVGNKVTIGDIDASWKGLRPYLSLDNVVIHDKFGNEALRLPNVSATLSWLSVGVGGLRLHSLEINRPDLDVMRDAKGNLYVGGIFIDTHKTGDSRGADWVLSQREIIIRGGRVRWNDYQRAAPELVLDRVDLMLRNHWHEHRFALRATPPAELSAPIDLRAAFSHPTFTRAISDAMRWKGVLYLDLRDTDLAAWKAWFDYPVDVWQGKGSVRAWLAFDHAKVADFTGDLMLADVSARFGRDLEPLNLAQVSGRVSVREEFNPKLEDPRPTFGASGHAITLTDFSLQTQDGLTLPATTISERFIPARNGRPARTEVAAKVLDLKTLAEFVERLPLPAEQRQILADFKPRGMIRDFAANWQGVYPEISSYSIKGQFSGLSMNARPPRPAHPAMAKTPVRPASPGIPGFENLTGRIDANDKGGSFSLDSDHLRLHLPGYFVDPVMPFDRLAMQVGWTFQGRDQLLLEVPKMEFAQDGLSGAFSGKHVFSLRRQSGKLRGPIDVSGRLSGFDIARIDRYLPTATPDGLRKWLTGALAGGTVNDAHVRLKGDLANFPFHTNTPGEKPKGEFTVAGRISNGRLNYAPGRLAKDGKAPLWPLLEEINGSILFDRTRMEILASSAKSQGIALSNVKAVIPDLTGRDMTLGIDGEAAGALQDMLRYVNESPVGDWIARFTDESRASGNARLALKLQMPISRLTDTKVQGALQFANNNVTLQNAIPPLVGVNGKLDFNEKGFSLGGIRATFLGGPALITGGTQRDGMIVVKAEGSATADGIRKVYPMPATPRATERITGSARYSTVIRVRNKRPDIVVESNLVGIGLDFPPPLRKAASDSMPLKFELTGLPSNDASTQRDEMKIALGSTITARYERQKPADKDAPWRVVRGGIGVNAPAPQPDAVVIANVNLPTLDIDAWRRVAASMVSPDKSDTAKPADAMGISQYVEPDVFAARTTELVIMGKKLDNVVVGASHQKGVWQANIDAEQVSGYVTWNESQSGRGLGRVTARLASLIIPKSAATDVSELLEGKKESTQMPGLDLMAENFELFGKKFGRLELAANNVRGTHGQEWQISKLAISNADGTLNAKGKLTSKDGESVTNLNYTLDIADAGKLLDRLGFPGVLRGGKGRMEGDLSWNDLPYSLDIPSLSGQIRLDIASGQFLKVDPQAAKLLGVLNLQSLPRRLTLDFRDVFSEGFAFDGINAVATIQRGVARTSNFKMRGLAATVLIDGTIDIAQESQNLRLVVIPEINAGAASVVYGLAVNPVIGVGTFLAQLFLRDPLMKAFTFEYQVTGPWKDPVVTRRPRLPSAPGNEASAERPG